MTAAFSAKLYRAVTSRARGRGDRVRLRASTIYADAWAAWRRDWPVLTAVAGMFVFLPQLALLLLVPDLPDVSTVTSADPNDPSDPGLWRPRCRRGSGNYGLLVYGRGRWQRCTASSRWSRSIWRRGA